ncbi:MAG: DUF3343 domain-containing protein [Finegoldia sp.]|nr:DUF3343 domain-containing protein [Finegoldia sp.]
MENIILTFTSVSNTMMTEDALKERGYKIKTIPTPREISKSCGLSIVLDASDLQDMIDLKDTVLPIGYIWQYDKIDGEVKCKQLV